MYNQGKQSKVVLVSFSLAVLLFLVAGGCSNGTVEASDESVSPLPDSLTVVREKWGIEPIAPLLSAGGYMIDFRYRVLDPEKARPLLQRTTKACLIDETTGAKMYVPSSPKVGPLRQTTPEPRKGGVYFVMFANPGTRIQRGQRVTITIGDCTLEDLMVQ